MALYGAWPGPICAGGLHIIRATKKPWDLWGLCCETGDFLGKDRQL